MTPHLEEITRRWRNGESAGLIAEAIPGLSRDQVIGLMWRRRIKRDSGVKHKRKPRWRPPAALNDMQVEMIRKSDKSLRALAARLGVGLGAVWRARNGIGAYAR